MKKPRKRKLHISTPMWYALERIDACPCGPVHSGLPRRTFDALEKRGLAAVWVPDSRWRITHAGRDALYNPIRAQHEMFSPQEVHGYRLAG